MSEYWSVVDTLTKAVYAQPNKSVAIMVAEGLGTGVVVPGWPAAMMPRKKLVVAAPLDTLFCEHCAGPYTKNPDLMQNYGGHWDTCPNRTARGRPPQHQKNFSETELNRMAQRFYEVSSQSGDVEYATMMAKPIIVEALRAALEHVGKA